MNAEENTRPLPSVDYGKPTRAELVEQALDICLELLADMPVCLDDLSPELDAIMKRLVELDQ